jgi:hypothetical protein
MATLLQSIQTLINNVSVTDRQETNIEGSLSNINTSLLDETNELSVERTFTNGSYERDTIIRPLDDIDLFAILKRDEWVDDNGNLPNPQTVLTNFKTYLNGLNDYKGKVSQDRPCVTIKLSDKNFDILPSFEQSWGGYEMPNEDLKTWTSTYPEKLTDDLNSVNKTRNYKVKPIIKAIKYWNRENGKLIPSYHIEEVAISIFLLNDFKNVEEAIRTWFNNAEYQLESSKFRSVDQYTSAKNKIAKVKEKLNAAKEKYDESKEGMP